MKRTSLLAAAGLMLAAPAGAQVMDPVHNEGMALYKEHCAQCHGWNAAGAYAGEDLPYEGASLVDSTLDRDTMIETVTCGRPGTGMPHHSRAAWTARRPCYGMVEADLPEESRTINPIHRNLGDTDIAKLVDFIQAFFQGQEMTREKCELYNGPSQICDRYQ